MPALWRTVAFALMGLLLSLPVLGDDKDKNKKAEPPKDEGKKAEVKKDGDKKNGDKKAPAPKMPAHLRKYETDPAAAEKKTMRRSQVQATIAAVVEDKKSLRLRITVPYVQINPSNYSYQLATKNVEVEWMASDDVKVRRANPPPQFDDKGRPKRYTKKELRELKGNDKQPGFPAEFSDLKAGQIVQVTLVQKKIKPRPIKRGKDKEAEGEWAAEDMPKMSAIFILFEPKD